MQNEKAPKGAFSFVALLLHFVPEVWIVWVWI